MRLRKQIGVLRNSVGELRAVLRQLRELPHQVETIDRRLGALDAGLRAVRDEVGAARSEIEQAGATAAGPPDPVLALQDSVDLVARRVAFRRHPTRVLFLVHLLGVWDSCHSLVERMAASEDFEPVVASIPRRFRGSDGLYGEEDVHRGLADRGVPHLRFGAEDAPHVLRLIKAIEPDVIFRQSQWDADVPDELGTERLGFARTCLVPYETMNIVRNVPDALNRNSAVDSDYHRAAWLVFCTNDMMREAAVRDGARAGAQYRVVGHPKADHLRAARPHWPLPSEPADERRPGRIVWSAHHTIAQGWTDFGAFHLLCDEMLAWATRSAQVQFVFMPHPALLPLPGSAGSPISRADFDTWLRTWAALPNTAVLSESDYGPVLAASDLMLTDGLSMLVEYQLFAKPMIFFEREGHRPFNDIGERVVQGVHTVHSVEDARELAEKLLGGEPDPLRTRQLDNAERLFGDEDSAGRVLATLRREIAYERGFAGGHRGED